MMIDPKQEPLLEQRLRRDAAGVRSTPSVERQARILAALDAQERAPARPSYRGLLALAALLLILVGIRFGSSRESELQPARPDGALASVTAPGDDVQVASGEPAEAPLRVSTAASVGERVSGWAASSSMALRASVDDPLLRELRALSLDLGRVLDTVLVDLPAAFSRLLGPVIPE
ncbi:MAG: hypothetical protein ACI8QZ_002296 [Chlamydiales bacterium]|jgi:hypothetical protein